MFQHAWNHLESPLQHFTLARSGNLFTPWEVPVWSQPRTLARLLDNLFLYRLNSCKFWVHNIIIVDLFFRSHSRGSTNSLAGRTRPGQVCLWYDLHTLLSTDLLSVKVGASPRQMPEVWCYLLIMCWWLSVKVRLSEFWKCGWLYHLCPHFYRSRVWQQKKVM